jgi:FkbM family methyltransferase
MEAQNLPIQHIIDDFNKGTINKARYIECMYELFHSKLHQYGEIIENTNIASIEITDGQVVMTTRDLGARFVSPKDDHRIAPLEVLNFASYEKEIGLAINSLVGENQTFLDIGANIGWHAINLALINVSTRVICFEPIPFTYGFLIQNLKLNGLCKVQAHNFGLSNRVGKRTVYYYSEGSSNASLANLSERERVSKIDCNFDTLDEFTKREETSIHFIKCDVEGAELEVFQGGIETISLQKPVIYAEILNKWSKKLGHDPNEVFTLLRNLGYKSYTLRNLDKNNVTRNKSNMVETKYEKSLGEGAIFLEFLGKMDNETIHTDFFFLHTEKHSYHIENLVL